MTKNFRNLVSTMVFSAAAIMATPAAAIFIDIDGINTDVGELDTAIAITSDLGQYSGSCVPGSNPTNEECWANGALLNFFGVGAPQVTYEGTKTNTVSVSYGSGTESAIGVVELLDNPAYFILKNAQSWALFENLNSTGYGVIDTSSSFFDGFHINVVKMPGTVSHITEFNGGDGGGTGGMTTVPEPTSLALLGAGFLVFGLSQRVRRRDKKS